MSTEGGADLEIHLEISRRAVEQLEAERERLERLFLRLPALLGVLEPGELTAGVTEAARDLVGARFALFLPPAQEGTPPVLAGLGPDDFEAPPDVEAAPVLAGVAAGEDSLRIDDVVLWASGGEAVRAYGVLADGRPVRSWLATPVRDRDGTPLGALYLGHHRAHAFTARHEELIAGLGRQLGVALEHAALFAERSRVAAALQETLLPPLLPAIPGGDVAARYRPTGAGNLVGGDFYDLFDLRDGEWGLVLGDVSGFGPEAAALTGLARYTIRAIAGSARSPRDVLAQLNAAMLRQAVSDRFLTAVFAAVRPGPGGLDVVLASGGHPPALVLREDESVEVLDRATGTLLGALPDVDLTDQELTLGPGDALVVFTDGVLEARDAAGTFFGLERLEAVLAGSAGRSAEGIARRVERAVLDHRGERTEDDVAIVVLRAKRA